MSDCLKAETTCFRCRFKIDRLVRYCPDCGQLLGTANPARRPDNLHCEDCYSQGLAAGRAEMTTEKQRERAIIDAASIEVQQHTIRDLKTELAALRKRIDDAPRVHVKPDARLGHPSHEIHFYACRCGCELVAIVPVEAPHVDHT